MAEKTREELYCMAQLAEHTERYDDMVDAMKKVVSLNPKLTPEERNLFSVAYKNVVGARRSAWRIISNTVDKAESEAQMQLATDYRLEIEKELSAYCGDVLEILNQYLIHSDDEKADKEAQVFYHKMKGDYYRYMVEVSPPDNRQGHADNAHEAYKAAVDISKEHLHTTNPIRLGLALNYSVFFYEIKNEPEEACKFAKAAFDEAVNDLEQVRDDTYKDSTLIMQLIKDNLTLWTSEDSSEKDDQA